MAEKRADTLLKAMRVIEHFTLQRAWRGLSDDELFGEPVAGLGVFVDVPSARPDAVR